MKVNRRYLYRLMFVLLLQSPDSMAAPTVITFDEYGSDTRIDDQYLPVGVIFRAGVAIGTATEIPNCWTIPSYVSDKYGFASPPGLRCRHPSLYFETDPDVSIISRFYDSGSGIRLPAYARKISFDLSIATGSGAFVAAYDTNGQYLSGVNIKGNGVQRVNLTGLAHELVITVPDINSKFAIDNLSFELFKLIIEQPSKDQTFGLTLNNYREAEVSYRTNIVERGVEFTTSLEYATSGGKGQPSPNPLTESFGGSASGPVKRTYTARGGKLTVNASYSEGGITVVSKPKTAFIVGSAISDADITARLYSLYAHGATPGLLTGIAMKESSYMQFCVPGSTCTWKDQPALYGTQIPWPAESPDGGSHIGLMQVGTIYVYAWDWHANTEEGRRLFVREKLPPATRNERRIRNGDAKNNILGHPGLRQLTEIELENMAVLLYGPCAPGDGTDESICPGARATTLTEQVERQYFAPACQGGTVVQQRNDLLCLGSSWEWIQNMVRNPEGVSYADSVRSKIVPR
jgi:hypothetical protein